MTITKGFGNHLPVLIKILNMTDGPVLECGGGVFSTPYLHWACYEKKRELVTYDSNEEYFDMIYQYHGDYHKVELVKDWDKIDLKKHWSMALIDHHPRMRRKEEIKRLANSCNYIIVHDTDEEWDFKYRYSEIYDLFKYRFDFKIPGERPFTTILSNVKKLDNLL